MKRAELTAEVSRLRRKAGALIVVAITPDDVAYDADRDLAPNDALAVLRTEAEGIARNMAQRRKRG